MLAAKELTVVEGTGVDSAAYKPMGSILMRTAFTFCTAGDGSLARRRQTDMAVCMRSFKVPAQAMREKEMCAPKSLLESMTLMLSPRAGQTNRLMMALVAGLVAMSAHLPLEILAPASCNITMA